VVDLITLYAEGIPMTEIRLREVKLLRKIRFSVAEIIRGESISIHVAL